MRSPRTTAPAFTTPTPPPTTAPVTLAAWAVFWAAIIWANSAFQSMGEVAGSSGSVGTCSSGSAGSATAGAAPGTNPDGLPSPPEDMGTPESAVLVIAVSSPKPNIDRSEPTPEASADTGGVVVTVTVGVTGLRAVWAGSDVRENSRTRIPPISDNSSDVAAAAVTNPRRRESRS